MRVVLASKNKHKLVEISKITEKFDIELVLQSELGIDIDVEETGTTFEENSFLKAEAVMKATGLPALADDSGIAVDALNGEPGVYSARYAGVGATDEQNNEKLLSLLRSMPDASRDAKFVCSICVCRPDGEILYAHGESKGEIIDEYRGDGRFGYDPIFYYPPMKKTFAEMTKEEKNSISHRGRAIKELLKSKEFFIK